MTDPRVRIEPKAVPAEIDRWNWGAFLLNWIWGIGNNTFIALLTLIPFVGLIMPFVLGAKGSGWAWRNGRWDSLEHFKRVQRLWAIWGAVIWIVAIVLGGSLFGGVFYLLGQSEAYQLGISKLNTSSAAADALGTPISTGIPSGSITIDGESGKAVLNFSATGPKAAGRVFVEALKEGGVWSLRSLTLKVDGRDGVIDLLKQSNVELESFRWRVGEHRESRAYKFGPGDGGAVPPQPPLPCSQPALPANRPVCSIRSSRLTVTRLRARPARRAVGDLTEVIGRAASTGPSCGRGFGPMARRPDAIAF
jgi:hypothetical protein